MQIDRILDLHSEYENKQTVMLQRDSKKDVLIKRKDFFKNILMVAAVIVLLLWGEGC